MSHAVTAPRNRTHEVDAGVDAGPIQAPGWPLLLVLVAVALLIVELAAVLALAGSGANLALFIALHGAGSLGAVLYASYRSRQDDSPFHGVLLALTVPFLGPFGPAGILLGLILHRKFRREATPFLVWYETLFPNPEGETTQQLYELIRSGRDSAHGRDSVTAFTDILNFGNVEQKRAAIALIAQHYTPAFAPALKVALEDSTASIRVQAASATAQIERKYVERIMALEQALARTPNDPDSHYALAAQYDAYARNGLTDASRARNNSGKALQHYGRCLQLAPERAEARIAYARLLLEAGEVAEALTCYTQCLEAGIQQPDVLKGTLEALVRQGRFAEARDFAERYLDRLDPEDPETEELHSALVLWRGGFSMSFAMDGQAA